MQGFRNIRAYLPGQGVVRTNIGFQDGKIAYIGEDASLITPLFETDAILVPGFIDEHIHGAGGADAMDGTPEALATISATLAKEGTTAFLATTMTQSEENISQALSAVKDAMENHTCTGAQLLGVHLEGPFISPKHVGAQPLEYVLQPSVEVFDRYDEISGGAIRVVSLAPECDVDLRLVQHVHAKGKIASVAHTGATYAQVEAAAKVGVRSITHTYNAQTSLHHREAGVVGAAMLLDEVACELICDIIHVSAPAIRLLIKNKPHEKVILITDAMRAKGMPDGLSELGGQQVIVKDGEARLTDGTLAGSVLKMNVAIKNLVVRVGIPFTDAVDFATRNPAMQLGILHERGTIEVGKRADVVLLGDDFSVQATLINATPVYQI